MATLGGWEINVTVGAMPQKVATAFAQTFESGTLLGCDYEPIAYLGQQVVNGINHAVLAEQIVLSGRDTHNVVIVQFNEKGNEVTMTGITPVLEEGAAFGGVDVDVKTNIPGEAKAALDLCLEGFVGSNVEPFALLGTQVTKGTDYIFAAEVSSVTLEPVKKVALVNANSMQKNLNFETILG